MLSRARTDGGRDTTARPWSGASVERPMCRAVVPESLLSRETTAARLSRCRMACGRLLSVPPAGRRRARHAAVAITPPVRVGGSTGGGQGLLQEAGALRRLVELDEDAGVIIAER